MVEMMKGEVQTVVFLVFLLIFQVVMFGLYDKSLCPEASEYLNTTIGSDANTTFNIQATSIISHGVSLKCTNLPFLAKLLFYVPIIIGLIYAVIPFK